ncbi:S-layer homology domain-containing protein [Lysinibacillus sp. NPDC093197]|uniref:S-layer homology domain-containing protein n=1 Tax=Lysinibacillus sp. NPDC093197 TaxID=3364132 RepID=UPI00380D4589
MSQYNELLGKINELEVQLKLKVNIRSESLVEASHKVPWDWVIKEGIIKGDGKSMNPTGALTRQQMATMIKRYLINLLLNRIHI